MAPVRQLPRRRDGLSRIFNIVAPGDEQVLEHTAYSRYNGTGIAILGVDFHACTVQAKVANPLRTSLNIDRWHFASDR